MSKETYRVFQVTTFFSTKHLSDRNQEKTQNYSKELRGTKWKRSKNHCSKERHQVCSQSANAQGTLKREGGATASGQDVMGGRAHFDYHGNTIIGRYHDTRTPTRPSHCCSRAHREIWRERLMNISVSTIHSAQNCADIDMSANIVLHGAEHVSAARGVGRQWPQSQSERAKWKHCGYGLPKEHRTDQRSHNSCDQPRTSRQHVVGQSIFCCCSQV